MAHVQAANSKIAHRIVTGKTGFKTKCEQTKRLNFFRHIRQCLRCVFVAIAQALSASAVSASWGPSESRPAPPEITPRVRPCWSAQSSVDLGIIDAMVPRSTRVSQEENGKKRDTQWERERCPLTRLSQSPRRSNDRIGTRLMSHCSACTAILL